MYVYMCIYVCMYLCMYVRLYVCMHVCMYVCIFWMCIYVCMYVCMHACMYVCFCMYVYICMYVCMYACMYAFMYVCMFVCMYDVCMYACMHACMYVYICMYVCVYNIMCLYVCVCLYVYVCMNVCMYVCMYACMHACMHVCMCVCMCVYMYVCIYVCVYMYVCVYPLRSHAKPQIQVGLICPAVHELIGLTGHVVVSWCFEVLCSARNCSGLIHGMTLLQYINSTKTGDGLSMLWIEYALYAQSLWFSLVVLGSQFDTSHTIQDNRTSYLSRVPTSTTQFMWIHEHEKSAANGRKLLHSGNKRNIEKPTPSAGTRRSIWTLNDRFLHDISCLMIIGIIVSRVSWCPLLNLDDQTQQAPKTTSLRPCTPNQNLSLQNDLNKRTRYEHLWTNHEQRISITAACITNVWVLVQWDICSICIN